MIWGNFVFLDKERKIKVRSKERIKGEDYKEGGGEGEG